MTGTPSVAVVVPVLDEADFIGPCLDAIIGQTYLNVVEILVVDGGSTDGTIDLVAGRPRVRVVNNPRRVQAAALNIALNEVHAEIIVRVDGHCVIANDYVENCVAALQTTGAAVVGGAMLPVGQGWLSSGIAAAMRSRLGAGPARFHVGGPSRWVDTVYLGSYCASLARTLGGYFEPATPNEDAEFAYRMSAYGGVWYDAAIRSTYVPRRDLAGLIRQFFRYGLGRSVTVRRHPRSMAWRQLVAPALVLGLLSPWRRAVAGSYATIVGSRAAFEARKSPGRGVAMLLALPAMHLSWGAGFLIGLATRRPPV